MTNPLGLGTCRECFHIIYSEDGIVDHALMHEVGTDGLLETYDDDVTLIGQAEAKGGL